MRSAFVLAASGAVLLACSSAQSLPPNLTCDAGCSLQIGVETIGESADAAAACAPSASDSACLACAKDGCCAQVDLCFGNAQCTNLSACEAACTESTCVDACQQQFPDGVSPLSELDSCATTECPSCTELGVGDSCGAAQSSCETGLTCNGSWCTKPCASGTDCAGIGPSGANALGEANACVGTATSGDVCFPGCALSAADCAEFPGTACFSVMSVDGTTVSVCQSVSDASAD